jgi:hypothetical protein
LGGPACGVAIRKLIEHEIAGFRQELDEGLGKG